MSLDRFHSSVTAPDSLGPEGVRGQAGQGRREGGKGSAHQCVTRRRPTEDAEMRRATRAFSTHCTLGKVTKPKPKRGKKLGPLVVRSSAPNAGATLPAAGKVDLTLAPKPRKKR